MKLNYSVLISVYHGESAQYLNASITSMLCQTLPPDQVVIVCDGPLTKELDKVLDQVAAGAGNVVTLLRIPQNAGLGAALNAGLALCRNILVVRMDSDDIARPDRCEKQLAFMEREGLDLCSAAVEEFQGDMEVTCVRRLPEQHEALVVFAKKRNPMNHPCTAFRKDKVELAGGYQHMPRFEDYDLWVRMIQNGAILGNLTEPLLYMRTDNGMYKRRSGPAYCRDIIRFWRVQQRRGFCSRGRGLWNTVTRCCVSLCPQVVVRLLYHRKLRGEVS